MHKSMSDLWPNEFLHQAHLCKSLCWKKLFMTRGLLLQHCCNRSFLLSLIPLH